MNGTTKKVSTLLALLLLFACFSVPAYAKDPAFGKTGSDILFAETFDSAEALTASGVTVVNTAAVGDGILSLDNGNVAFGAGTYKKDLSGTDISGNYCFEYRFRAGSFGELLPGEPLEMPKFHFNINGTGRILCHVTGTGTNDLHMRCELAGGSAVQATDYPITAGDWYTVVINVNKAACNYSLFIASDTDTGYTQLVNGESFLVYNNTDPTGIVLAVGAGYNIKADYDYVVMKKGNIDAAANGGETGETGKTDQPATDGALFSETFDSPDALTASGVTVVNTAAVGDGILSLDNGNVAFGAGTYKKDLSSVNLSQKYSFVYRFRAGSFGELLPGEPLEMPKFHFNINGTGRILCHVTGTGTNDLHMRCETGDGAVEATDYPITAGDWYTVVINVNRAACNYSFFIASDNDSSFTKLVDGESFKVYNNTDPTGIVLAVGAGYNIKADYDYVVMRNGSTDPASLKEGGTPTTGDPVLIAAVPFAAAVLIGFVTVRKCRKTKEI